MSGTIGNPWDNARAQARRTAQEMKRSSRDPIRYQGDDGTACEGWSFHYFPSENETKYFGALGSYNYEEYWGQHLLFLGVNGKLYEYQESNTEYGKGRPGGYRIERGKILRLASTATLARLGPGKPYAALCSMLERLPRL